jgi:hypothetical protein
MITNPAIVNSSCGNDHTTRQRAQEHWILSHGNICDCAPSIPTVLKNIPKQLSSYRDRERESE